MLIFYFVNSCKNKHIFKQSKLIAVSFELNYRFVLLRMLAVAFFQKSFCEIKRVLKELKKIIRCTHINKQTHNDSKQIQPRTGRR